MRVFAVPSWSAFVFSLIYWACIAEPAAWVQTHASHNQKQREGGKRERRRRRWEKGCETCMERSRCLWKGKKSEEGAEKEKRQKSRQKDRELLFIYLFLHSPPPFFFSKKRQSSPEALLRPGLHIWGVTNARGPINNGWPSSLQQMGPTASAPAPPLQEALGGAAAQSKQPHREKWSSRK